MELLLPFLVWLFAVTHVDTFVILVAFCADKEYRLPEVAVGHLIGFAVGLVIAIGAALLAAELFAAWAFMLGIVPIGLGLYALAPGNGIAVAVEPPLSGSPSGRIVTVASAGVGVSGENVAAYVPVFVALTHRELAFAAGLYVLGAILLFLLAVVAVRRVLVVDLPTWVDSTLVPITLILVGTYVLLTGAFVV